MGSAHGKSPPKNSDSAEEESNSPKIIIPGHLISIVKAKPEAVKVEVAEYSNSESELTNKIATIADADFATMDMEDSENFMTDEMEIDDGNEDYITEHSHPSLVTKVVQDFVPLDESMSLLITGTACPRLLSGGQKTRIDEAAILKNLRDEGLIAKPLAKTTNGLSFEIVEDANRAGVGPSASEFRNPMARLDEHRARFESRRTAEEISQKLTNAESRRKKPIEKPSMTTTMTPAEIFFPTTYIVDLDQQRQKQSAEFDTLVEIDGLPQPQEQQQQQNQQELESDVQIKTTEKSFSLLKLLQ